MPEKQTYPKMPESNWWALRNQFQKTLPATVNTSYLKSLLNLTNEKSASNLIPPLKILGLIDDEGKPTQRAKDWRLDIKYQEACREMLKAVYPQALFDLFPSEDVANFSRESLNAWFMDNADLGAGAASFVAAMYILLCEGTPKAEVGKKTKSEGNKVKTKQISNKKAEVIKDPIPHADGEVLPSKAEHVHRAPSVHIDLQIHISPEASADQIDNIFSSIAKHFGKQ